VLFILFNAESAQRGNGKRYLKNLLKITCIRRKAFLKNTIKNIKGSRQRGDQRGSVGVVHECKIKTIHISGPMVQSEALAVAKSLGNDQVKASTG
jgi:CRISPR/Cas system Type II protein with McrA/HNH and RuvC-like nuclease domain